MAAKRVIVNKTDLSYTGYLLILFTPAGRLPAVLWGSLAVQRECL